MGVRTQSSLIVSICYHYCIVRHVINHCLVARSTSKFIIIYFIDYITNSELDNVLEEIGPLDLEEVDELGETIQSQDTKYSISADITDPMIALRKLLEYTITHSCLTSTDLIRSLVIIKKFLAAYTIWCHHSSSLKGTLIIYQSLS